MALTKKAATGALIGLTSLVYLGVSGCDSKEKIPIVGKPVQQLEYRQPQVYDISRSSAGAALGASILGLGYLGLRGRLKE